MVYKCYLNVYIINNNLENYIYKYYLKLLKILIIFKYIAIIIIIHFI